ncbi:hypothetical protein D9V96_016960 [Zobellia laminariae]|uniref:hypothetical protein n=1 Tax=Zobellia laminariae TaxID=248906 RepID=UPI0012D87F5C|nr:hypothetical protein [Zobellia laminariae]
MTKSSDWKIEPMPKQTESFYSGRKLLFEEYSKLVMGFKPTSMDDKWFIYSQNESIYFHRSWLGHCIFIAKIVKSENDIFIGDITANKKPDQFGTSDIEVKKEMFNKLLDYVLHK